MDSCCKNQKLDRITGRKYKCFSCGATFAGTINITNMMPYESSNMLGV